MCYALSQTPDYQAPDLEGQGGTYALPPGQLPGDGGASKRELPSSLASFRTGGGTASNRGGGFGALRAAQRETEAAPVLDVVPGPTVAPPPRYIKQELEKIGVNPDDLGNLSGFGLGVGTAVGGGIPGRVGAGGAGGVPLPFTAQAPPSKTGPGNAGTASNRGGGFGALRAAQREANRNRTKQGPDDGGTASNRGGGNARLRALERLEAREDGDAGFGVPPDPRNDASYGRTLGDPGTFQNFEDLLRFSLQGSPLQGSIEAILAAAGSPTPGSQPGQPLLSELITGHLLRPQETPEGDQAVKDLFERAGVDILGSTETGDIGPNPQFPAIGTDDSISQFHAALTPAQDAGSSIQGLNSGADLALGGNNQDAGTSGLAISESLAINTGINVNITRQRVDSQQGLLTPDANAIHAEVLADGNIRADYPASKTYLTPEYWETSLRIAEQVAGPFASKIIVDVWGTIGNERLGYSNGSGKNLAQQLTIFIGKLESGSPSAGETQFIDAASAAGMTPREYVYAFGYAMYQATTLRPNEFRRLLFHLDDAWVGNVEPSYETGRPVFPG